MSNQDSKIDKIGQPHIPSLTNKQHDFVPPKETAMHKAPPKPLSAPKKKK